jgi:acyl-coenzyme A thioesterase PaaI-like protein
LDYDALRDGLNGAIPFNTHLGLSYVEVGPGRGVVELPDDGRLHNHVGSQHAGGLFAAGEAASGGAFLSAFAEQMGTITPLARGASIDYRKLARGPIRATAVLSGDLPALIATLDAEGRVEFPVEVEMTDGEGNVVATMTVQWHVRRNAPA